MMRRFAILAALLFAAPAAAQDFPDTMSPGPVFPFGPVAEIESEFPIPEGTELKIVFDLSKAADAGEINQSIVTLARVYNMHVRAGVPEENIHLALVVHGPAAADLMTPEAYAVRKDGKENPNIPIVQALLDKGVRIYVCGQANAFMGIEMKEMLPGVKLVLSAITAHALLQQEGYTLNPF